MWGEGFEFSSQPIHDDITVHLFKDSDKKKKKDKDYVGLVNLSVDKLLHTHKYVEAWWVWKNIYSFGFAIIFNILIKL